MVRGTRPAHVRGRRGVVTCVSLQRGSQEHQQQTSHQPQLHDRTSQFGRHLAGTLPQILSLRQIHLPQQLGVARVGAQRREQRLVLDPVDKTDIALGDGFP